MWKILKDIKIQRIWYGGVGISSFENWKKIIIKWWVVPEMVVDCKISKNKKDYTEAKLLEVKQLPSEEKLSTSVCKHYKEECGGCRWSILCYSSQIELKKQLIQDSFWKLNNYLFKGIDIISSERKREYRNKVEFSFWKIFPEQQWNFGYHKQGFFYKVIDVERCYLVSEKMHKVFEYMKEIFKKSWLPVYDQKTHKGFFRHLVIRYWYWTDQLMLNISVADNNIEDSSDYKQSWQDLKNMILEDKFIEENVDSFYVTYNNQYSDAVKSEWNEIQLLKWNPVIEEKLSIGERNVFFNISPFSFFQTNTVQAQNLFDKALKQIEGKSKGVLIDLYCGTWTIGLSFLASWNFEKLIWVDISSSNIEDARENAKINWLENKAEFVCEKAEKYIFDEEFEDRELTVVVDPPRDGLHKNVVKSLIELKNKKDFSIIYISCNPVTLARDLWLFLEKFEIQDYYFFDMFPQTYHIESLFYLK